jgi:YidC/Oxa1 family membrane protein insertase
VDRNTVLAIALSLAVYSLWLAYQTSQAPPAPPIDATQHSEFAATSADNERDDARVTSLRQDSLGSETARRAAAGVDEPVRDPEQPSVAPWQATIEGELYRARLSNRGGSLTGWQLREFVELDGRGARGENIELVNLDAANPSAFETAFEELGVGDFGQALYRVESEGRDRVVFSLKRGGVEVRKTYEFDLEGYGFELLVEVRNDTDRLLAPDFAIAWPAVLREGNDYLEQSLIALHGDDVERDAIASVGGGGFFDAILGGNGEDEIWRDVAWAGVDLKYFAAVLLPDHLEGTRVSFDAREVGESAAMVLRFPATEIAPGEVASQRVRGFLGPKEPALLEVVGRGLSRSVDLGYSWFEPLTRFFQWLLTACYQIVPNYGWSIILITILVRLLSLPIMNRQMRSMEKMRGLQPRLKEIQAEFSDDRQKQSEATMALYKETGVNPLGGCFPMLLQFPVFIGLFFALKSSFELRQAPFMLWINDLSAPEALFVIPGLDLPFRLLPVIMGASMILQQKLTPTTVDPSQQMMMMFMMPVMMTVLFYQFPSGLVLYWMISNFLGIAHQMLIGRRMKQQA